ncbi:MAG: SIS domain-containing protein [Deltaproteobacteria bacterium]|nr:SIS domain-containing protein [Deltaproteobacteria bacterium]
MIQEKILKSLENLKNLLSDDHCLSNIQKAADWVISSLKSGNKLIVCGNGGSAADAQHLAAEFLCRFYKDRKALAAIALTTDTSTLTAIANDYAFEDVFSRQLEGIGKKNDILIGISTSGSSKNVLKAFQAAAKMAIRTILLTGSVERDIAKISDLVIKAPSDDTPRIQEMHLLIEHILSELVEKSFLNVE